jgi:hypothetical protein
MSILSKAFIPAATIMALSGAANASIAPLSVVTALEAKSPKQAYTAVFDTAASVRKFEEFAKGAEVNVLEFIKDALEEAHGSGITAKANVLERVPAIINMTGIVIPKDIVDAGGCAEFTLEWIQAQKINSINGKVCTKPEPWEPTIFSFK